jgi:hypothetical protein
MTEDEELLLKAGMIGAAFLLVASFLGGFMGAATMLFIRH